MNLSVAKLIDSTFYKFLHFNMSEYIQLVDSDTKTEKTKSRIDYII